MLFLALDLKYLSELESSELFSEVKKVIETSQGLRRYLKTLIKND